MNTKFKIFILFSVVFAFNFSSAQKNDKLIEILDMYEANAQNPYGKPNDNALEEIKDFDKLIGICHCKSVQYRGDVPGDTLDLKWRWKYILNGNAVQDDGWFGNENKQSSFTSIRILNPETKQWQVPFFVPYMSTEPQIWVGGKKGDTIELIKTEGTQNDQSMESVLTFSEITEQGFNWTGKMVNLETEAETIFWKIWCIKQ